MPMPFDFSHDETTQVKKGNQELEESSIHGGSGLFPFPIDRYLYDKKKTFEYSLFEND